MNSATISTKRTRFQYIVDFPYSCVRVEMHAVRLKGYPSWTAFEARERTADERTGHIESEREERSIGISFDPISSG